MAAQYRYDIYAEDFANILDHSPKDNTYKFAFARFLLEYCKADNPDPHVPFSTIAEYFLKYYWYHHCKAKFWMSARHQKRPPEIVQILDKHFTLAYYPEEYEELTTKYKDKYKIQLDRAVADITKKCFTIVTWKFQNENNCKDDYEREIKENIDKNPRKIEFTLFDSKDTGEVKTERGIYYDYGVERIKYNARQKKCKKIISIEHGIKLNPHAMKFFKDNYLWLYKSVILEWSRFHEKFNVGIPRLIEKTNGTMPKRGSLAKFNTDLKDNMGCFYCGKQFDKTSPVVDHVIPFKYIGEDEFWNLVRACPTCNGTSEKYFRLSPEFFIEKLIKRNEENSKIEKLAESWDKLGNDSDHRSSVVWNHYNTAKSHGWPLWKPSFNYEPCL